MKKFMTQRRFASAVIIFFICLFTLSFTAGAAEILWDEFEVPSTRQKERLLDNADLLTDSEEADILRRLDEISYKWQCDLVILTVDDHTGDIQSYADDYFDYNGFGKEFNDSGFLFMLSMFDREWAFSGKGTCGYAITDYGREYLFDQMRSDLADDDYYGAFSTYISTCDWLLQKYSEGTPYDYDSKEPKTTSDILGLLAGSILGGLVIALIPILKMKSDLKTVKMVNNATNYQSGGGIRVTLREDRFIKKALVKTPIPKDNGSRGGHSGGSTFHTSSSGSSHTGSHGHF
jgi:uncharacterized protein